MNHRRSVYGRNPLNGQTAWYHELDSRDPVNSTGGYDWTPSGQEFVIYYQANILITMCMLYPDVTPLVGISFHARCALHKGTPEDGTLDGGAELPEGAGYYHYHGDDPPHSDAWGGCESTLDTIASVGEQWSAANTTRFGVGDISREGGGSFQPDHDSHQNGLDIDMRYLRTDGAESQLNLATSPSSYSRSETLELLQIWAQSGNVDLIYVSNRANITQADLPGVNLIIDNSGGHDDHFHVRLKDPDGPDSNNC